MTKKDLCVKHAVANVVFFVRFRVVVACLAAAAVFCLSLVSSGLAEETQREGRTSALTRLRGNMLRGEWEALLTGADGAAIKRYELALFVRLVADDGWKLTGDRRTLLREIASSPPRAYASGALLGRLIKEASRNPTVKPLLAVSKERMDQCFGPECPKDWYYAPDGAIFLDTPNMKDSADKKDEAHQIDLKEIRKTLAMPYQRYVDMRHWESYYACFKDPYDIAFAALVALLETRHGDDIPEGLRPIFLEFANGKVSVDTFALLMEQACEIPELFPLLTVRDDFLQSYHYDTSPVPLLDPRPKFFKELCQELRLMKKN